MERLLHSDDDGRCRIAKVGNGKLYIELISEDIVIPACSQGAIAIEIRENDPEIASLVSPSTTKRHSLPPMPNVLSCVPWKVDAKSVGSYSKIKGNSFEITGFISVSTAKSF